VHLVIKDNLAETVCQEYPWRDGRDVARQKNPTCGLEPPLAGDCVVVQQCHHVSLSRGDSGVHTTCETHVLRETKNPHPWALIGCDGSVFRAVVDEDDFVSLVDN